MQKLIFTVIVSFLFLGIGFTQKTTSEIQKSDEVYSEIEEMPRFPGCEDMDGTLKEVEFCAKEKMLVYIYKNLKYPLEARRNKNEGICVVQFYITEFGEIEDIKLAHDLGDGLGDAAVDVVRKMQSEIIFIPAYQNGKEVKVYYTLPIRFKLQG